MLDAWSEVYANDCVAPDAEHETDGEATISSANSTLTVFMLSTMHSSAARAMSTSDSELMRLSIKSMFMDTLLRSRDLE